MENLVNKTSAERRLPDLEFWRGRQVFLTGHTGFKGAWLALVLDQLGAHVTGFALPPETGPSAYDLMNISGRLKGDLRGDLRDRAALEHAIGIVRPDVSFHLAAQALVGRGLRDPFGTFETNVGGTLNLLEALAPRCPQSPTVIVTSDKVYRPAGGGRRHIETDALGGSDPYSASKAACEHVVAAYRNADHPRLKAVATARAGNVIGGGDFAEDRIIPDIVRADVNRTALHVRRPEASRPFQHVLDVLVGYVLLAEDLGMRSAPSAVNFGPADGEIEVRWLIDVAEQKLGRTIAKEVMASPPFEETNRLALDSTLARSALGWCPRLDLEQALSTTFNWYRAWSEGEDVARVSEWQVIEALSA